VNSEVNYPEGFYETLIWSVLDLISVLDPEGRMKYHSPSIKHILGYDQGELYGKNVFDFVHPDDLQQSLAIFRKALRSRGKSEVLEHRFLHRDGRWLHFESVGWNLLDHPLVGGIVVTSREITQRKRMEEELRRSEELYRKLVDISPDAITMSDLEGNITFVSRQTLTLHGYQHEGEMLGMNAIHLAAPEDRERALSVYRRVILEGQVRHAELTALKKDGSRIIIEISISLLQDEEGNPQAMVAFSRDITERKRMETLLQRRNEELEAFAHTLSHDLQTPIAVVEGYARAALEADQEGRTEAERECLESIVSGARRMRQMVNSLLEYAKAGHLETEFHPVEPEEVLAEVLMDLEEGFTKKGISLSIHDDMPLVLVDPVRLRQVFSNLISNAMRHMGEVPSPRIEIGARQEKGTVTFYVRDNGRGIPLEVQPLIFQPFRRYSSHGSPGLGIGLSTVKRAVESWGGRVWVESEPGRGATFFFTAPLAP
jgi:PAS domain S-box-containing protein